MTTKADAPYKSVLTDRIRERLHALDLTAAAASKIAFNNDGTIRNILIGASKHPRSDTMTKLAEVLQTTPAWLTGASADEPHADDSNDTGWRLRSTLRPLPKREDASRPTPVYASVEGGDGALIVSSEPIEYAPRPQLIPDEDDLYGVVVEGTSMGRVYRPGDTVWIHPRYRERRDEPCVFRGFNEVTGEARATIKWLVEFNADRWVVEQIDPPKRFELSRQDWPECYRVLGKKNRA